MKSTLTRKSDGEIELNIVVPWATIQDAYEEVVEQAVKEAEIPGFRKGKAPRKAVEEKLDQNKLYEEAIGRVLPKVYQEAITEHKLRPIMTPKIELKEAKEKTDWTIVAHTTERPEIDLGTYKTAIKETKASKGKKIWTPGEKPEDPSDLSKKNKPSLDEVLMALYGAVKATIPAILLETEVNKLLSDLIDQTKKLGLSVEQYLSSTGKTAESIRKEYEEQARRTLVLEFALEKIADTEGILISDDDIAAAIATAKSDEEKKALESQRYYLASVLRRQKTIDFLTSL